MSQLWYRQWFELRFWRSEGLNENVCKIVNESNLFPKLLIVDITEPSPGSLEKKSLKAIIWDLPVINVQWWMKQVYIFTFKNLRLGNHLTEFNHRNFLYREFIVCYGFLRSFEDKTLIIWDHLTASYLEN